MPMRPPSRFDRAMASPLPRSPSRLASGRVQLFSVTAQVSEALMPILCSLRSTTKPGLSVGTRKADRPFLPSSGSVTAKTMASLARLPLLTNCLAPLSTHWPSRSSARVRRLCASEPACGSVRQKQPMAWPLARSGNQLSCCTEVPYLSRGPQPTELWMLISAPRAPSPAEISSTARA
ncbi:hypothetical protein D3C84_777570 [compost metagenome]